MADSTLTLTYKQSQKSVVYAGEVAIREQSIDVTVVNGTTGAKASTLASTLVLEIRKMDDTGDEVPIGKVTSWSASGDNAVGALNLNTEEAIAAFSECGPLQTQRFIITLYTTGTTALMCTGVINVRNCPTPATGDPVTIDQAATISNVVDRVEQLEAQAAITPVFSDFEELDFSDLSTNEKRNAALRALLAKLQGN